MSRSSSAVNRLVSIIVPVFNVENYIRECMDSILRQTHSNIEVIAIDDGSSDESGQILDSIAFDDSRLIILHTDNHGVSAARNLGLSICTGDFLCFVDADDVISGSFVEGMLALATQFDAQMVISTRALPFPMDIPASSYTGRVVPPSYATAELLYPRIPIGSWNKLFCRTFLSDIGLVFDTRLFAGEGQYFITAAAQYSQVTVLTDQSGYFYRVARPGSAVTAETAAKWINALESISAMRMSLQLDTIEVRRALDFHEWETRSLILRYLTGRERDGYESLFKDCKRFIRAKALGLAVLSRVSMKYRARMIASAISPTGFACAQRKWGELAGIEARRAS